MRYQPITIVGVGLGVGLTLSVRVSRPLWLNYIAGHGYGLGLGFQKMMATLYCAEHAYIAQTWTHIPTISV